ncbi:MAG: rRNA pseudouridine synthase [Clostridia bacterium]|nr:rRNA pseudouridine synthase [Clostridia bacterium]
MRLDKFIADTGIASRKECAKAAKSGLVTLNGKPVRDVSVHVDENTAQVTYCGKPVIWRKYLYLMLNKPSGYISTSDGDPRSIMRLLPQLYSKTECFPCGRLDIDTVGLLIVTNDGPLAHELLSPRHHVEKTYFFRCSPPLTEEMAEKLRVGVDIGDIVTKPAGLVTFGDGSEGEITLTEGKFHQIKRMLEAVGSKITYLQRIKFGGIPLDASLEEGKWRELSADEINTLINNKNR